MLSTEVFRRLLPHPPTDSVHDIGLAAAIGANDAGDRLLEVERDLIHERLKAQDFKLFDFHSVIIVADTLDFDGRNPDPVHPIKQETITVDDLFRQYMDNRKTLAVSTKYQYEAWFKSCLADWRDKDVTQITGGMVVDKLNDLAQKSGKVQAQNSLKLLRTCYRYGLAVHPQILKHYPVDAVKVLSMWEKPNRRKTIVADTDLQHVFPGRGGRPHVSNPRTWQESVTEATGINFCFHDLRRTFITIAEGLDIPHYALKALLNHAMGNDVTGGYVVMTVDRLREPMQRIADKIMELVTAKPVEIVKDH